MATTAGSTSRFEMAPPRRFILPAVLLLLSEGPGYGYALLTRLEDLRFGRVDRPAVYRALAQLERDGLVEPASPSTEGGRSRRIYRVTELGERVLRVWMGVIKEEHDHLGRVLRRYQATGTTDALLAEVDGGWASALGSAWSSVSSTSATWPSLVSVDGEWRTTAPNRAEPVTTLAPSRPEPMTSSTHAGGHRRRFRLVASRSVVLVEVRSTVGPLSFGAVGLTGTVDATVVDGLLDPLVPPSARLTINVSELSSGNGLYDAELLRRIDARRFPIATLVLEECEVSGPGPRYQLKGPVTFHGVTRPAQGTVTVQAAGPDRLVITGEQAFDIRDFAVPSPTVLMLRIYPDVRVRLHVEAVRETGAGVEPQHKAEAEREEIT